MLASNNPQAYEPDLSLTLNNLAFLYANNKRLDEAEPLYLEALNINKRLAEDNPMAFESKVISILENLAILYTSTKRQNEAEEMFQAALDTNRLLAKVFPKVYESDLSRSLNNTANHYKEQKKYTEAETMYLEALTIRRRLASTNPQHEPMLATLLNNLAGLYRDTQRITEAENIYQEALAIRKRLAKSNPQVYTNHVARTLWSLSYLYLYKKDFSKAEKHVREAISLNPAESGFVGNLAAALLFQGKYAEAEAIYCKYKNEMKDDFLEDLQTFADEGIIPKERENDVNKVKQLLNE